MQIALSSASSPQECGSLAAKAEAVRKWAKHIGLSLEEQNRIARFRLDCMRKAGALLRETVRPRGAGNRMLPDDIDKMQSSRWQRVAQLEDELIDSYMAACDSAGEEVTHAGLLRYVGDQIKAERQKAVKEDVQESDTVEADIGEVVEQCTSETREKFACIYADPPWQYENQDTRGATDNHYPTMPLDDICALPIKQIAADNAHLHLWTTNAFLFDAKRVMEEWGFTYKSCFVWVKPQMGMGNYWRVSHEFLLLGVRGKHPFNARNEMSWRELPRGRHSAKPDAVRQAIERVSPGPRIELFARERFEGWSAWGNQTKSSLFVN